MHAPAILVTAPASPSPGTVVETAGVQFQLDGLPGYSTILETTTLGREIWQIFKATPDLPGVIFVHDNAFVGMLSSTQFLETMSKPFGREIFEGRPISLWLEERRPDPLILPHTTGIQEAVESCLQRPRELVYEPFMVVNEEEQHMAVCSVQTLLHASAQVAQLRNQQMDKILGSVTDGLLLIDGDFRIGGEYSKALEGILGRDDFAGKLFVDVLRPVLDGKLLLQTVEYLRVLFDKKLIDRLIKSINPVKETTIRLPDPRNPDRTITKYLSFNFERVRSHGEITQILLRIEDITRRVTQAREIEEREAAAENRLKLMLQIVNVAPDSLNAFLAAYETELRGGLAALQGGGAAGQREAMESIFREVHRLKGDAALLHLEVYRDQLHGYEDQLSAALRQSALTPKNVEPVRAGLEGLLALADQAREAIEQFSKWHIQPRTGARGEAGPELAGLITHVAGTVREVSGRVGKKATFHALFEENLLPAGYRETLKDALAQLARNAVIHGIEMPADRAAAGKTEEGVIQIALEQHDTHFELIVQDDGAGLNWEKIRRKARASGLPAATEADLKEAIFTPSFSTADTVTQDAGRGIGMDLVRTRIAELGGRIVPHSQPGVYCAFQIFLPRPTGGSL